MNIVSLKIGFYTCFALLAFAANSIFCRLALSDAAIDPSSFTAIRLLSGMIALTVILRLSHNRQQFSPKRFGARCVSALLLFIYALSFSYAYVTLETATGALVLFAAVQITMIVASVLMGHRLERLEWAGIFTAFTGFVYLVWPDLSSPSLSGFILMVISGVAWGGYTLAGKGSLEPLRDTCLNFLYTLPLLGVLIAIMYQNAALSSQGLILAILSGAIASGLGYTVWYMALKGLSITQAAVVQLTVPAIAALGGVLFASEVLSLRLLLSSLLILGGILAVIMAKRRMTVS
jgi:drug/metabolite transporter (DMT)-like permease